MGVAILRRKDVVVHLPNFVRSNMFETSPRDINAVFEAIESGDQDEKDQLTKLENLATVRDLDLELRTCQKSWKSTIHAMEDE